MLRLTKKHDGAALTFLREDGTVTTSRTRDQGFFATHDLMHYAVETSLGFRSAFIGLLARGHDIAEWEDSRSPLRAQPPAEALHAEVLVGLLHLAWSTEGEASVRASLARINAHVEGYFRHHDHRPSPLAPQQLQAIADRFAQLLARWGELRPGETLVLPWPA